MKVLKERIEERGRLWDAQKKMLDLVETEKRAFTEEEQTTYDKMEADMQTLDGYIERRQAHIERGLTLSASAGTVVGNLAMVSDVDGAPELESAAAPGLRGRSNMVSITDWRARKDYTEAFRSYIRSGDLRGIEAVRATLQVDVDAGGGFYAASAPLLSGILANLDTVIALLGLITRFTCGYGESLGQITLDGDVSEFEWGTGELTAAAEDTGVAFGKRELKVHPLKRKLIKVSKRLIASPWLDVESFLVDRVNVQLGNTLNRAFMLGTGALQPLGLFVASDDGIPTSRDVTTGSATNLTADALIDAQDTLKTGYQAGARWLTNKGGITRARKLKLSDSQMIWQPGLQVGQPSQLLGKPYVVDDMVPDTWTTAKYVMMYGDFSYYWAAVALSMTVQRLVEVYASTGQIGLLFDNMAADGMPAKAEAFVRLKTA